MSERVPGFVFAALAVVLVVLVASAFTPAQPPPPPTAELAPEAQQAIRSAPPEQDSRSGADSGGPGGSGGGGTPSPRARPAPTAPSGSPSPAPPTVFRCIGDPPRQTADPQSPPCVTDVVADNGGATSMGVDRNTIRVAIPDGDRAQVQAMLGYFNQAFNFHGRRLTLVPDAPGCFGGGSAAEMKEKADSTAQLRPFAVVGWCDAKGTEYPYYDQLATHGVVSVANRPGLQTEAQMQRHHPYEWTFWDTFDVGTEHIASLACTLTGRDAAHAGPDLQGQQRKFGLFYNTFTDAPSPDLTAFFRRMDACGATIADAHRAAIPIDRDGGIQGQGYSTDSAQRVNAALLRMRQDGVTTIVEILHPDTAKQVLQQSSGLGYQPEHVISSWLYMDSPQAFASFAADQAPHVFGVSAWNPFLRPHQEFWYDALRQGDPAYDFPYNQFSYYGAWFQYYPLLVLAAGIQMAGPHLTPFTFAKGLQQTRYPNPTVPGHPEGFVSIAPGQHSYISDASVIWADPSRPDPDYASNGTYCYVDVGRRFTVGTYPADLDDRLFTGTCRPSG